MLSYTCCYEIFWLEFSAEDAYFFEVLSSISHFVHKTCTVVWYFEGYKICLKFASIFFIFLISYLTILLSWHKSWYNVCILKFYQVVWLLDWETQSLLFQKLRLGNRKHLLPILAMVALVLYIILRSCCWKSRQFFCGQGLFSTTRNKKIIENYLYHIN